MSDFVFTPDLDSYNSTDIKDSFGMFSDIVLTGWNTTETYFSYQNRQYDTTFGFEQVADKQNDIELSFNIVIERQLGQAIIVSLTLVIVIMVLLFSLIIMITSEEKKLHFYGMSARGAIGTASSLIFSVLTAHINLRQQFSGGVAYLEMFYYVAYLYILISSVLIYIFMKNFEDKNNWMVKNNALIIKLLYWPLYIGIMLVITLIWL